MPFGPRLFAWLSRFVPARSNLQPRERIAACVGGLVGLLVTAFVTRLWLGSTAQVPWLVAPIGASTVLVFGVPASPLAQPWSVVGGNFFAALIGVTAARYIGDPFFAGAVAVARDRDPTQGRVGVGRRWLRADRVYSANVAH